jgi:hypothetical protein
MSEWARLPGEPDEYWQCMECEWICLPDAVPTGAAEVTCPECGDRMLHVTDDPPEGWELWEATIEAVRRRMDSRQN